MTRGRFYATAMPIWAVVFLILILTTDSRVLFWVGIAGFVVIALAGSVVIRPPAGVDRSNRSAARAQRRAARGR